MMLTEPHTVAGKVTGMPKGTKIFYDKSIKDGQPAPRAAIVATRDLGLNSLDNWCNRDCAAAVGLLHGRQTVLASVYCDIKLPVVQPWLESLLDMTTQKGLPLLLCMDSNSHSELFGPDGNARGADIEDLILSHGLSVANDGITPTFEVNRGDKLIQTFIDVTLHRDLPFQIEDWTVDRSYNASDHNTIRFSCPPTTTVKRRIRPWGSADWDVFKDILQESDYRVPAIMSMKKLDKLLSRLYALLSKALDAACPEIDVDDAVPTNLWSTEKHSKAKDKVSALYKKAKKSSAAHDWDAYRQADREFKKMCKNDKNKEIVQGVTSNRERDS